MKINKWRSTLILGLALYGLTMAGCFEKLEATTQVIADELATVLDSSGTIAEESLAVVPFDMEIIDEGIAGDVKLVGDIDGDGFPDLVIGGMPNEKLNWYRYPDWQKIIIATPSIEFTTDGALGDVDGDDDLDIVVPDGDAGDNLLWFENPLPGDDPLNGEQWERHVIGAIGSWGKDIELADFDNNGFLDAATRSDSAAMIFFQTAADEWQVEGLSVNNMGYEGMASGDINGDENVDLVFRGSWLRNPGGSAATGGTAWKESTIGDAPDNFKALVVDLNRDGQNDVLFSSSEDTADVVWWTPESGDATGDWSVQIVLPDLEKGHTLQAADMDLDGDIDVVLGQMHTSAASRLMILANSDGQAMTWEMQVIGDGGLHNGVVADIGNDGDMDIFGSNWTGNPPVRLWVNRLDNAGPMDRWTYKQIADDHAQTFGLAFGDVDGDDRSDIISGRYWYRNPGGGLLGDWARGEFPDGMHAILFTDIDDDEWVDILAMKDEGEIGVYWLEATGQSADDWDAIKIGSVEAASHSLGAQGYAFASLKEGETPVVLLSSGAGIYMFRVPDVPAEGDWPRVHVSGNPSDEGLAVGDIDGDGLADIAATTGDSKRIEWYRNPGDDSDDWAASVIGVVDDWVFPDRIALADLNEDGGLDVVVTEENGNETGARTIWLEQPLGAPTTEWDLNPIVTQGSTNSLDTGDVDGDGHIDVILAEHRGQKKLSVWLNDGTGNLTEFAIDNGKESHLGSRLYDLDGDGDLDIVSIAWDEFSLVHFWRNDNSFTPIAWANFPVVLAKDPEVLASENSNVGKQCEERSGR